MPVTRITLNFEPGNAKQQLVDEFHALLIETLRIKEFDRLIVIDEKPAAFFQPLNTSGNYALIELSLFKGRTLETKRTLYQRIVDLLHKYDVDKQNTRIILHEIDQENWGIRGGKAASDVALGFDTSV